MTWCLLTYLFSSLSTALVFVTDDEQLIYTAFARCCFYRGNLTPKLNFASS